jgi:hypothetical protein
MPLRMGDIPIRITLYQMFLAVGSARLSTLSGGQLAGTLETNVTSHVSLASNIGASQTVYGLLVQAFHWMSYMTWPPD